MGDFRLIQQLDLGDLLLVHKEDARNEEKHSR